MVKRKYTIKDFNGSFKTDADCLRFIFNTRYPDGAACKCGKRDCFYPVRGRRCYSCSWCGHQISPTAGTIFHKSETSLRSWFFAMFLISNSKNGVAAAELARQVGVTYKTAWRMGHQIRRLMDGDGGTLKGIVEADETYIGGRVTNMRMSKRPQFKVGLNDKTAVVGLVERGGNVQAKVVNRVTRETVLPNIFSNVERGSIVCTDEHEAYRPLTREGFIHNRVAHQAKQYVFGSAHTNTIEGFWSQLKRSINGTYHHVSPQHLQKYVDEFAYRYNRRKLPTPMFADLSAKVGEQHALAA